MAVPFEVPVPTANNIAETYVARVKALRSTPLSVPSQVMPSTSPPAFIKAPKMLANIHATMIAMPPSSASPRMAERQYRPLSFATRRPATSASQANAQKAFVPPCRANESHEMPPTRTTMGTSPTQAPP